MSEPLRVLVKGLNWTGSGAVVDLLKEYKGVVQVPGGSEKIDTAGYKKLGEFNYFRGFGLVGDQIAKQEENTHPSVIKEVVMRNKKRSITKEIRQASKLALNGHPMDALQFIQLNQKISKISLSLENLAIKFEGDIETKERIKYAQQWITEIVNIVGKNNRAVIFDQPINFGQHDAYWPIVFEPYKLIIVYRDPRDQFAERAKHGRFSKGLRGDFGYLYGWDLESVLKFRIDATLARMKAIDKLLQKIDNKSVMLISFEQLVNDYYASVKRIEEFVGLIREEHTQPKKFFDPDCSSRNIGVYNGIKWQIPESMLSELIEWYNKKSAI